MSNVNLFNHGTPNYFEQLALRIVQNKIPFYQFGRIDSLGVEDAIVSESSIYGLPLDAETIIITSSSVDDNIVGDGARLVGLEGLDENWDIVTDVVPIGVPTTKLFRRVYRAIVLQAGTINPINGNANLGVLTFTQTTSLIDMLAIGQYKGLSSCSCFTVPRNYYCLVWNIQGTSSEGKRATFYVSSRINNNVDEPFVRQGVSDAYQKTVSQNYVIPVRALETTDILLVAKSYAVGTSLSSLIELEIVRMEGR